MKSTCWVLLAVVVLLVSAGCGGRDRPVRRGDGGPRDASTAEGGSSDAGRIDAGRDAGLDASEPDAGPPDAGPPDAGPPDAGPPDAGPLDGGQDAGTLDAGPRYCLGSADPTIFISGCQPLAEACDPDRTCSCSAGDCTYTTCTGTTCEGSTNGTMRCADGTSCVVNARGSGFCARCGVGATCAITDTGSAGGQQYFCEAGSHCTVDIRSSSGGRWIHCEESATCEVSGSASGYTRVDCNGDCLVDFSGGFQEVCCRTEMPTRCSDGRVVCGRSC